MRKGIIAPLVKLVIFLVVTAFATYVLGATIANTSYGSTYSYKALFTDAAGVNVGDDVRVAGVRVGSISGIKIVRKHEDGAGTDEQSLAELSFTVVKSRPLPSTVQLNLRYRNLVGQRYLDVEQGSGADTGNYKAGATIGLDHTHPAVDLTALFQGFQPLFQGLDAGSINELSTEIIQTLQGEGGALMSLLSNLASLTNSLADKDQLIGDVIDNLSSVLTTVQAHDQELSDLITELAQFVSGLANDRSTIAKSIDGINALTTNTAGLLQQVRPPLANDIVQLSSLAGNLQDNKSVLQFLTQNLASTIGPLIRTASYGSWFNFYLCSVSGTITLPGLGAKRIDLAASNAARCQ